MRSPAAPVRKQWFLGVVAIIACAGVLFLFRWATAAELGEKCGGATGCAGGLVCVQIAGGVVANVVEHRRCRQRCESDSDCKAQGQCVQIGGSRSRACMSANDFE